MKTTIEIADDIFRAVKARASLNGQTLRSFFLEALQDKLKKESKKQSRQSGWRKVFSKAPESAISEVQDVIDKEFSQINPDDWK